MAMIIVLFNLKLGIDPAVYEQWARETDLPTVKGLSSIAGFTVHRSTGLLGSDATPPYQYVEIIDVADMDGFGRDVASDRMQAVAATFQGMADPTFILTEPVG